MSDEDKKMGILTPLDTSNNPKIVKICKESKLQRPGTFCLDGGKRICISIFLAGDTNIVRINTQTDQYVWVK